MFNDLYEPRWGSDLEFVVSDCQIFRLLLELTIDELVLVDLSGVELIFLLRVWSGPLRVTAVVQASVAKYTLVLVSAVLGSKGVGVDSMSDL